jgi:hypothetical protein
MTMHGVSRRELFVLAPSDCARRRATAMSSPSRVLRTHYGVESWRWALTDDVNFRLRVRLKSEAP